MKIKTNQVILTRHPETGSIQVSVKGYTRSDITYTNKAGNTITYSVENQDATMWPMYGMKYSDIEDFFNKMADAIDTPDGA